METREMNIIPVRLPRHAEDEPVEGRRAYLHLPERFYSSDREWISKALQLYLADDEGYKTEVTDPGSELSDGSAPQKTPSG